MTLDFSGSGFECCGDEFLKPDRPPRNQLDKGSTMESKV